MDTLQAIGSSIMQFVNQGIGVCLGVVVGVVVTIIVQRFNSQYYRKKRQKNFKFELEWISRKIDGWLEELTELEKAITTETLDEYDGFFEFSTTVYPTANEMFQAGELYGLLEDDQIGELQEITARLSLRWENYLNNIISQNVLAYAKAKAKQDVLAMTDAKGKTAREVKWWEEKFKGYKENLGVMISKL